MLPEWHRMTQREHDVSKRGCGEATPLHSPRTHVAKASGLTQNVRVCVCVSPQKGGTNYDDIIEFDRSEHDHTPSPEANIPAGVYHIKTGKPPPLFRQQTHGCYLSEHGFSKIGEVPQHPPWKPASVQMKRRQIQMCNQKRKRLGWWFVNRGTVISCLELEPAVTLRTVLNQRKNGIKQAAVNLMT